MPDVLKTLLDFLKLTPRYLTAVGLVAGLILFGADSFRDTLGLTTFARDYRFLLGLLFLSSIVLLLVAVGGGGIGKLQCRWRQRRVRQRIRTRLQRLTEDEKQILRYYIAKNTRCNYRFFRDPRGKRHCADAGRGRRGGDGLDMLFVGDPDARPTGPRWEAPHLLGAVG